MTRTKQSTVARRLAAGLAFLALAVSTGLVTQVALGPWQSASAQFDNQTAKPLSPYMGDMQRYSQKLGYAITKKNQKLADFYTGEIRENVKAIRGEFEQYEGMPIGTTIQMLDAPAQQVDNAVSQGNWKQARSHYNAMIQVCNSCHATSQRAFVRIEPVSEKPPYNQNFEPKE